ncbi:hypothetical protein C9925_02445 [cyanobacterium G8-9]|nr:hypothetical protein C9925_02445 [cyanobacterium G8-9]
MRSKYLFALTVGTDIIGGILAGILVGAGFDWAMEEWAGIRTAPWGLMFFFLVGIVAGFKNAYYDLKKLERRLSEEEGKEKAHRVLEEAEEGGGEGGEGRKELKGEE